MFNYESLIIKKDGMTVELGDDDQMVNLHVCENVKEIFIRYGSKKGLILNVFNYDFLKITYTCKYINTKIHINATRDCALCISKECFYRFFSADKNIGFKCYV